VVRTGICDVVGTETRMRGYIKGQKERRVNSNRFVYRSVAKGVQGRTSRSKSVVKKDERWEVGFQDGARGRVQQWIEAADDFGGRRTRAIPGESLSRIYMTTLKQNAPRQV
jgi:hypothetical protein